MQRGLSAMSRSVAPRAEKECEILELLFNLVLLVLPMGAERATHFARPRL